MIILGYGFFIFWVIGILLLTHYLPKHKKIKAYFDNNIYKDGVSIWAHTLALTVIILFWPVFSLISLIWDVRDSMEESNG